MTVLIYAPLAPLILPVGTAAFALTWWGYRYVILYTGFSEVETEGRLYFHAVKQLSNALYTIALCLAGLFALNFLETRSVHSALQAICTGLILARSVASHHRAFALHAPLLEHAAICRGTDRPEGPNTYREVAGGGGRIVALPQSFDGVRPS